MCDKNEFITSLQVRYREKSKLHDDVAIDGFSYECTKVTLVGDGKSYPKEYTYDVKNAHEVDLYGGNHGEWGSQFAVNKSTGKFELKSKANPKMFNGKLIVGGEGWSDIETQKDVGLLGLKLLLKDPEVTDNSKNPENLIEGKWVRIATAQEVNETYTVSVESSDSSKDVYKQTDLFKVTADLGFKFGGVATPKISATAQTQTEVTNEINHALSLNESKTYTRTCKIEGEQNVQLYQWVLTRGDPAKSKYYRVATNDVLCQKVGKKPLCEPWLCETADCQTCKSKK